jgi:TolB protein
MRKLISFLLFFFSISVFAQDILTIEITGGQQGGLPIAIVPFGIQAGMATSPIDMAGIISSNLHRSGRFDPMSPQRLPALPVDNSQVQFPVWQQVSMPHLVIGRISGSATQGYTVEFQLFDVFREVQLLGLRYTANSSTLRQVAHQISDAIYQAITGERGVFATRIVYVTVTRGASGKIYRLNVADADGGNPQIMLESKEPILSPAWSPDGQSVAYVSFEGKRTAIYVQNVRTGRRNVVSSSTGLNSAPAWSPDGTRLAMSLSKDGNSEIYVLNLRSNQFSRLTNHPAIDTEPDWSPDGSSIVFTSDRGGNPQIYQISATGGTPQRLTFTGNYNARPRFSPTGTQLAVLHNGGSGYRIALYDLQTRQFTTLSRSSSDESPTFAPNGSMVLYGSGRDLAAVSSDGRVHQRLAVDSGQEVREPAWSPFAN